MLVDNYTEAHPGPTILVGCYEAIGKQFRAYLQLRVGGGTGSLTSWVVRVNPIRQAACNYRRRVKVLNGYHRDSRDWHAKDGSGVVPSYRGCVVQLYV